jgi:hypothetical protein
MVLCCRCSTPTCSVMSISTCIVAIAGRLSEDIIVLARFLMSGSGNLFKFLSLCMHPIIDALDLKEPLAENDHYLGFLSLAPLDKLVCHANLNLVAELVPERWESMLARRMFRFYILVA